MPRWNEKELDRLLLNNPDILAPNFKRPEELPPNLLQRAWDDSQKRMNKYGNRKVVDDGHTFDSAKEHRRYLELRQLAEAGRITDLRLQPTYILQERFLDNSGRPRREIVYKADFEYRADGKVIIEDVKSPATESNAVFRIKWKLLLHKFRNDKGIFLRLIL